MDTILSVLVERDGMASVDALNLIEKAKKDLDERLAEGGVPYDICEEWFGLEPEYIMELL